MKKVLYIVGIIIISTQVLSQVSTLETKATKLFEGFNLEKAIEKYKEVGVENLTTDGLRNYADSYRYLHLTEESEKLYSELVNKGDKKASDRYMYAEMLLMNKKQEEWKSQMDQFYSELSADSRAGEYKSKEYPLNVISKDKGQFTAIKNLEINTSEEDFGPSYNQDKVVFSSSRLSRQPIKRVWNWTEFPYLNLYESTTTETSELEKVSRLTKKINKKFHEGPASFSEDGNLMVFTRNNYDKKDEDGSRKLKLFYREKNEKGKWGKIEGFDFNNKEYSVGQPALTPDGKTLYFASDMPGGYGGTDIYVVNRNDDGSWTIPKNLGKPINTEGREMFPFYHKESLLFFASDGHVGLGGLDVFVSKLVEDKGAFPENLGYPLNDSKDDFALILNPKQTKGYFSSNRPGGKGSDDIYSFNLVKPFNTQKTIKGIAKDKERNILAGVSVNLLDETGEVVGAVITTEDGLYEFTGVEDQSNYTLTGDKKEYRSGNNITNTKGDERVVIADLQLDKQLRLSLIALVTDKKNGKKLNDVRMTLINKVTGKKEEIVLPTGEYSTNLASKIGDQLNYELKLEREGYFPKTVNYSKLIDHYGKYKIHESLDLGLTSLEKGVNIADLIEINPIYFDFNKYNIRSDAATELNKIVEVMNKYPTMIIELGSHTDCRGKASYNTWLSIKRAEASAVYIKKKITNSKNIYGKGYGESKLINGCTCEPTNISNCSKEEHQLNRRTEFRIIKIEPSVKIKNNSPNSF